VLLYFRSIEDDTLAATLATIVTRLVCFCKIQTNPNRNRIAPGILHLGMEVW
jgi:hypothetical protein